MSSSFVITNIGLDRAAQANEYGISLTIKKFVVGDAYDYTPSVSDTKIHGNALYEAAPSSYKYTGNKTVQIMCTLPDSVGPFAWGEVGLYLDTGELFALAALPKPQNKYSSLESDIASSVTFYCYITLAYDTVQVTIDYGDAGNPNSTVEILDVYKWSTVRKPSEVPLGISELIVHELSPSGNTTLLIRDDNSKWTVASTYDIIFNNAVPVSSTKTYLEYDIERNYLQKSYASNTPNQYIAQFPDGTYSSFSSVTLTSDQTRLRFNYSEALDTPRELDANVTFYQEKRVTTLQQITVLDMYPVGSVYITTNRDFDPNNSWGGTWTKIENRFLLGSGNKAVGTQGGEETVRLTETQVPRHTHTRGTMNITGGHSGVESSGTEAWGAFYLDSVRAIGSGDSDWDNPRILFDAARSWTGETSAFGGGQAHNNMPPYQVVVIWNRVA